jgi:hypothetical protein
VALLVLLMVQYPDIELHFDSADPKYNALSLRLRADRMGEADTQITHWRIPCIESLALS